MHRELGLKFGALYRSEDIGQLFAAKSALHEGLVSRKFTSQQMRGIHLQDFRSICDGVTNNCAAVSMAAFLEKGIDYYRKSVKSARIDLDESVDAALWEYRTIHSGFAYKEYNTKAEFQKTLDEIATHQKGAIAKVARGFASGEQSRHNTRKFLEYQVRIGSELFSEAAVEFHYRNSLAMEIDPIKREQWKNKLKLLETYETMGEEQRKMSKPTEIPVGHVLLAKVWKRENFQQ